jgi:hypothetical protein
MKLDSKDALRGRLSMDDDSAKCLFSVASLLIEQAACHDRRTSTIIKRVVLFCPRSTERSRRSLPPAFCLFYLAETGKVAGEKPDLSVQI